MKIKSLEEFKVAFGNLVRPNNSFILVKLWLVYKLMAINLRATMLKNYVNLNNNYLMLENSRFKYDIIYLTTKFYNINKNKYKF
jgi:hypothetical protein